MSELAEIRTMLAEQNRSLGRIEGALSAVKEGQATDKEERGHLDRRLRKVENKQHWYAGLGSMLGLIGGVLFGHKIG